MTACCVADCGGVLPPAGKFVCKYHLSLLDPALYRELCEAYYSRRFASLAVARVALAKIEKHIRDTIEAGITGTYSPADRRRAALEPFGRARSREEVG